VASGGLDRKICLWDLSGAGSVLKIENTDDSDEPSVKGSVYALATTPNVIAAGGPENVVRLWDAKSGKKVTKLVGHTDMVRSILVAQDGETIMSASSDQTVKVWSVREGRCMYTMTMHNDSVWGLYSDDPKLEVFYSYDKSGLMAKTDIRGRSSFDDGLCVAIGQDNSGHGLFRLIQHDGYIWTGSSTSTLNCWKDVSTDDAESQFESSNRGSSTNLAKHRLHSGSISKQSFLGGTESPRFSHIIPLRRNSSALTINQIPIKSVLRLSNTAHFPVLKRHDAEVLPPHIRRKNSVVEFEEDVYDPTPIKSHPEYSIHGQHGLVKHFLLNDKRRILTEDTSGEVMLWDLIKVLFAFPLSFGTLILTSIVCPCHVLREAGYRRC
jgi:WD repeat-containing protein 48